MGQQPVHGLAKPQGIGRRAPGCHIKAHHLGGGMHAGVGAARHPHGGALSEHNAEGVLKDALDGAAAGLLGPACEARAVVLDIEPKRGNGGVPS